MPEPDDRIQEAAMDAASKAIEFGYRPCSQCGTWHRMAHMELTYDDGTEVWTCGTCWEERNPETD